MKKPLNERQKKLRAERLLKKRLQKEADQLWHLAIKKKWGNICFFHKSDKEAFAHQKFFKFAHHIKPKNLYPHLRYDLDNGLNVCWPDHYKLEKVDRSMMNDVVAERGKVWYNRLEKKAKGKPIGSYLTISYYQDKIKELKKYLC